MTHRFALVSLLALSLVSCASSDSLDNTPTPRSRYSGEIGESPVGVIPEEVFRDTQRNKDIPFSIHYPTRSGPHPLILFSHGFGGSYRTYVALTSYWASQGYVVIAPSHADSGRRRDVRRAEDIWESQTPADWRERVRDLTLFLDSLDELERRYTELQGKIDRTKVAVGGHSYGAFTAMLIGGTRTFPGATAYADPRVKAVLAMSPQGPSDVRGLTAESWNELRIPALFMTGGMDRGVTETETPEWRRQAYELSPAGDKWLIVLEGARHGSFTGRIEFIEVPRTEQQQLPSVADPNRDPERDPRLPDERPRITGTQPGRPGREGMPGLRERGIFAQVKAISLAFLDTYLRGDAEGRTALEAAGSRGGVELQKK
ncbi:MAG TPA: alpha/beta fold hydrolase [Thermoanaerobaculia bacterium]|nr:alpha/beta fold hydrolase [Thermoanaerobaculia bacterium]